MISWKCKIGYIESSSRLSDGSNINQINFIEDSYYTIPVGLDKEKVGRYSFSTPELSGTYIESILGDDYYSVYKAIYSYGNFLFCKRNFPSLILAYPITIDTMKNFGNTRDVWYYVYFPTLNRLMAFTFQINSIVYSVKDSIVTTLDRSSVYYGIESFGNGITEVAIPVYDENSGIDYTNLFSISTSYSSSGNSTLVVSKFTASQVNDFRLLFPEGTVPDYIGPIPPDNPYEPGGDSGEGGGGGTFDDDSDPIPDSSLPTLSSAATGFTRIYNPTLAQLNQLATYLWTDESIIQTIWNHAKQFFEDPMSVIIGLNIVPVPVPNGGTENFRVLYIDTGIPLTYAASQFVDVDCGTLEIKRYYGSALDQAPYTKISCFLPFIGTVQLNTDEVMGATLQVKYRVDICSGSTVAKIFVDGNCIYQYSGHCAINVPISSADFSSYVSAAISVAKLAIGAAVGGGMTALAAAGADPIQHTNNTTTIKTTNTERNPVTGRQITMGTQTQTIESVQERPTTMASFSGLTPANISNTVGEIMTAKPHVEHSGSFSGNTGYLGVRRPFVIIERPNMCMPASYQQFNGFPCMITLELAECSGFTKVQQVQLTGMSATNPEQAEILDLLKTGVII